MTDLTTLRDSMMEDNDSIVEDNDIVEDNNSIVEENNDTIVEEVDFNNDDNDNSVIETFQCSICKELLCEPITLLCQHSYCFECIKTYHKKNHNPQLSPWGLQHPMMISESGDKCPICKFPFTIPPKYNSEFESALKLQFPNEYALRMRDVELNKEKDVLHDEMRREVWNMISEKPPTKFDGDLNAHDGPHAINIRNGRDLYKYPIGPPFQMEEETWSEWISYHSPSLVLGGLMGLTFWMGSRFQIKS
jgi:hypothetical protein